jgi:acyl carrier protein
MMIQANLEKQLKKIVKDLNLVYDVDKIPLEEDLFASGAIDSLVLVQYILALEEELKISIPNTDINYENFKSFSDQIKYLSPLLYSNGDHKK